ncbi:MAG: DUF1667 domain-containing protein [Clostridiales bacterium]|jgi:CxxC motif-containing protein|nr:DUF1667 domain-containing protein [Clostridiales bacterium]
MQLICILCPRGCHIEINQGEDGKWEVKGYACKRGRDYAIQEATCPLRVLTTSIWVEGGNHRLVSAKTDRSIPKDKIIESLKQTKGLTVKAPIDIGDVLIENIAGTGANLIATRRVDIKQV